MEAVAWVGLVVSWIGMLAIVKLVSLTLRVLKHIRRLTEMTRDAARHLADNVSDDEVFAELELLAGGLAQAVRRLPVTSDDPPPRVSSVSPGLGGEPS